MAIHSGNASMDALYSSPGLPSEFVRLSGDFSSRSLESMIVTIPGGQKHGHKYNQPNNSSCILKLKFVL